MSKHFGHFQLRAILVRFCTFLTETFAHCCAFLTAVVAHCCAFFGPFQQQFLRIFASFQQQFLHIFDSNTCALSTAILCTFSQAILALFFLHIFSNNPCTFLTAFFAHFQQVCSSAIFCLRQLTMPISAAGPVTSAMPTPTCHAPLVGVEDRRRRNRRSNTLNSTIMFSPTTENLFYLSLQPPPPLINPCANYIKCAFFAHLHQVSLSSELPKISFSPKSLSLSTVILAHIFAHLQLQFLRIFNYSVLY